ncbi:MAG: lysoplasmalogenase [Lachnospiraceae bacterium]|nr:lysoplasmalogenase [Lachnospiraceae bacterium]
MYYFAYIAVGAVLMEFLLLPIYIRLKNRQKYAPLKIFLKGCMTFIPVVFCAWGVLKLYSVTKDWHNLVSPTGFRTSFYVLLGLTICLVADVLLVINFSVGMMFFLAGHICYILYFLTIASFNPISIALFIIGIVLAYRYYSRFKEAMGKLWPAYYLYAITIMTTLSLGIMLPFDLGPYGILPALAACLTVISDFMLAANRISGRKPWSDLMYLSYYFTGQFFMSLSVFIPVMLNL